IPSRGGQASSHKYHGGQRKTKSPQSLLPESSMSLTPESSAYPRPTRGVRRDRGSWIRRPPRTGDVDSSIYHPGRFVTKASGDGGGSPRCQAAGILFYRTESLSMMVIPVTGAFL